MGASTPIMLTATVISFGNEWINTNNVNFRIPIAGFGIALILDGIEKVSPEAAVGIATIALITVCLVSTGAAKKSPAQTLADLAIAKPAVPKK